MESMFVFRQYMTDQPNWELKITLPNESMLSEVTSLLQTGHRVKLRARGNSMLPFITGDRDSIILQKKKTVHRGDIVLARIPDRGYILHRIIAIRDNEMTLMGDGNLQATEQCNRDQICGTVIEIIRNGRYIRCSSVTEQCKAWLWMRLRPLRRYLLAICRIERRLHV